MEIQWIGVAFVCGWLARRVGQPPLLGYLAAGFALEALGLRPDRSLEELSTVGVQLLLFSIGLKLDLRGLARPQVWGVATAHMLLSILLFGGLALALGGTGLALFAGMSLEKAALIGFALSFSSTVFVVKFLEERDDLNALYGKIAIGVLVIQDLAAVIFLTATKGELPSPYALGLLLLIPARPLIQRVFAMVGHGELLVLGGLAATLAGAQLFELVGLKGDLGALTAGVLMAGHAKTDELAKSLLGLKDVLLVGFFLSVGLTGLPTWETAIVGVAIALFTPLKSALFFWMFTRSGLRGRTSLFAGVALGNSSEFGLIVGALALSLGWLESEWLITMAIALSTSYLISTPLNQRVYALYRRYRARIVAWETPGYLEDEQAVEASDARALVFGLGRVGANAYDALVPHFGERVVGFDVDADAVERQRAAGRRVVRASATDADFWDRLKLDPETIEIVLLAMGSHMENRTAIEQLRAEGYRGFIAATARFEDEVEELVAQGADVAFHVLAEAGSHFAGHALDALAARAAQRPVAASPG